jgi:hypothetical protein
MAHGVSPKRFTVQTGIEFDNAAADVRSEFILGWNNCSLVRTEGLEPSQPFG